MLPERDLLQHLRRDYVDTCLFDDITRIHAPCGWLQLQPLRSKVHESGIAEELRIYTTMLQGKTCFCQALASVANDSVSPQPLSICSNTWVARSMSCLV